MSSSAAVAPLWRTALCSGAASPAAALAAALPLCRRLSAAASFATGTAASSASPTTEEVPVIIAGAGPTGLTTALLLAKYGVRSMVLEKSKTITDHPQAHFINMRCMEVFRSMGGAAAAVLAGLLGVEGWVAVLEWLGGWPGSCG